MSATVLKRPPAVYKRSADCSFRSLKLNFRCKSSYVKCSVVVFLKARGFRSKIAVQQLVLTTKIVHFCDCTVIFYIPLDWTSLWFTECNFKNFQKLNFAFKKNKLIATLFVICRKRPNLSIFLPLFCLHFIKWMAVTTKRSTSSVWFLLMNWEKRCIV